MKEINDIKDMQMISLGVMKYIDEVCEKIGVKYCLAYGTLIGAIRHKGFIPWDDDLDIMMQREDYEKFCSYMKEQKDSNFRICLHEVDKNYPYAIARVSDDNYVLKSDYAQPYKIGGFVDVYPMDMLGDSEEEGFKLLKPASQLSSFAFLSSRIKLEENKKIKKWKRVLLWKASRLIGNDFFVKKLYKFQKKHEFDHKTKYIGCLVWTPYSTYKRALYETSWFDELIKVPYEDGSFYVPKAYDEILTKEYGDYMKLPPEEERIGHHYYKLLKK